MRKAVAGKPIRTTLRAALNSGGADTARPAQRRAGEGQAETRAPVPNRDSCKQLLPAIVRSAPCADNAGMSPTPFRLACLPLAAVALTLAGCVVAPLEEPYYPAYDRGTAHSTVIYTAPPAPPVEYQGWPPASGYVWIDGYWNWGGARYAWIPGRWVEPRPSQVWVPRVWQRDGERWRPQGGHWEQRREERREERRPAPPAPVWQRSEPQPQPLPPQSFQPRPEPPPYLQTSSDGWSAPMVSRSVPPQFPAPGLAQLAPERRKAERHWGRPREPRPQPAAVSQEFPPGSAEATLPRRGPDDGRRSPRKRPEDGEPRDKRPIIP